MRIKPHHAIAKWVLAAASLWAGMASAAVLYSNGFETNTVDWTAPATRVASGTAGITSSSGSFHATQGLSSAGNVFTRWGGQNFGAGGVPTAFQEFTTSVDVYLDVGAGLANNTRFDFSSALNKSDGTSHLRDFIFNAGFFNDATGPGANTNRFVISASNNSQPGSAFAKNPAKNPIAISTTGWYTFEHHFTDNGGVLAAVMSIYDAADVLVNSWTLSDPTDLIAGVGGNRYGWFDYNQIAGLAFDNAWLAVADATSVPEPGSLALVGLGLAGLAAFGRRALRQRNA